MTDKNDQNDLDSGFISFPTPKPPVKVTREQREQIFSLMPEGAFKLDDEKGEEEKEKKKRQ